ncbi:MAG: cyclic nucleotide-binding domain-containing protein [Thiotrichales bacterium]
MQHQELKEKLRQLAPLALVKSDTLDFIIKYSKIYRSPKDSDLTTEVDNPAQYLFLLDGTIAILQDGAVVSHISHQHDIAKYQINHVDPKKFRVIAAGDIVYVTISKREFDMSVSWQQVGGYEVEDIATDDNPNEQDWMARFLRNPIFYKIPSDNLQTLFYRLKPIKVAVGDVVVSQGEAGDFFYVVASGKCQVIRQFSVDSRPMAVAELNPGDLFGEEALIVGTPRNATVKATREGVIMRLSKDDFLKLVNEPATRWIKYGDAARMIKAQQANLIDVRLPNEFQKSRINQSCNLPLPIIRRKLEQLTHDKPYIVYCDSGKLSQAAAFILEQHGYVAHVLKGGLLGIQTSRGTRRVEPPQ